jgi:hypothetical protein
MGDRRVACNDDDVARAQRRLNGCGKEGIVFGDDPNVEKECVQDECRDRDEKDQPSEDSEPKTHAPLSKAS